MIHPTDMNENKWMNQLVSKDRMNHLFHAMIPMTTDAVGLGD